MDTLDLRQGEKKGPDFEDRRVFARLPIALSLQYAALDSPDLEEAETCDISAKGIGLLTKQRLTPQSILSLKVKLPEHDQEFATHGKVVWALEIQPQRYRVGIVLEKTGLMAVAIILKQIHSTDVTSPGTSYH